MGGTSIDCNVNTPLILNEEKLNMADLHGQPSDSCPVLKTNLNESEAVTSVTGGDAVGNVNSQLPSQPLAFTNISVLSEANLPGADKELERRETTCQCSPEVIDCEVSALKTTSQSDGTGRVLGMNSRCCENEQMELVRTCKRIPRTLSRNDSDVESRSAARTDPEEVETSDVVTSMHGSRGDFALGERVKEKNGSVGGE